MSERYKIRYEMSNLITNFNNKALELMKTNVLTGFIVLFIWSFSESSFFPIPPDPVMWALIMINPELWWLYALVTTVASVLGALFGYFIGDKAGRPILKKFIKGTQEEKEAKMNKVENLFREYENMAILIAALTPIPYKIFTIMGGIIEMPKKGFIFWSIIGRGTRFFLGAYLFSLMATNAELKEYIGSHMELIFTVVALIFAAGFVVNIILKKRNKGVE